MNDNITVVVSSCDRYEEAWDPFFFLFHKYWNDCPYEVILNTETKVYSNYNVRTVNSMGKWCQRLLSTIEQIDSNYILLFLEDFLLQNKVDSEEIRRTEKIMESNDKIGCIYYKNINTKKGMECYYDRYLRITPTEEDNMYVLNFMVGLWRKSVLFDVLNRMNERSPWDVEVYGYYECKDIIDRNIFLCSNLSYGDEINERDVFGYFMKSKAGIGITKSKWLWNTKRFLRKEGIRIHSRELPTMSYFEFCYYEDFQPFIFKAKQFIKRRILLICKVFNLVKT